MVKFSHSILFIIMNKTLKLFLVSLFLLSFSVASTSAYSLGSGRSVDLNVPLTENFYAAGGEVNIDQPITGDAVIAGGIVNIQADISGDVLILGGKVNIYANVGDSVRVIGGTVSISGNVKHDVVVSAGTLEVARNSTVGGSVLVAGGIVTIDGNVSEDVAGSASFFKLKGWVNGNVDVTADDVINISNAAKIKGDLKYYSRNPAIIPAGIVGGKTERRGDGDGAFKEVIFGFFSVGYIIMKLLTYISLLLVGLLLFLFVPHEVTKIADMMRKNFWKHLGLGFLVLTSGAAFSLVAAITVVGVPLSLIVAAAIAAGMYITPIVVGLFLGNIILKYKPRSNSKAYGVMALGMFIYTIVCMVPLLGALVSIILLLAGFGSFVRRQYELAMIVRGKK